MLTTTPTIPPSLRLLPLAEDAQRLFARAVHLARHPAVAREVRGWLERHYSENAVWERLMPGLEAGWDENERELKIAPSPSELRAYNAIKDRGCEGRARWRSSGYTTQDWRSKREWRQQHKDAMQHPNYLGIMAERRYRLKLLKSERRQWRPTLPSRLILAVEDLLAAPFLPGEDLLVHAREVVAIGALLMPEPLPELGELGSAPWENTRIRDASRVGRHETRPDVHHEPPNALSPRIEGRGEAMFVHYPCEPLRLSKSFSLDALLTQLLPAVEAVEGDVRMYDSPTISRADAAKRLQCDPGHVSRLVHRGTLRRVPGATDKILLDAASVEAYAKSHRPRRKRSLSASPPNAPGLKWDCFHCGNTVLSASRPKNGCKCGRLAWTRQSEKLLPPE